MDEQIAKFYKGKDLNDLSLVSLQLLAETERIVFPPGASRDELISIIVKYPRPDLKPIED